MHHKEVCLAVDTARLILSSFPDSSRLVVGGIGPKYQATMVEMMDAMKNGKCLVLFPADGAVSFAELEQQTRDDNKNDEGPSTDATTPNNSDGWDVIVIDGTWAQARKLYTRYMPLEQDGGPPRVQLSDDALKLLSNKSESSNGDDLTGGAQVSGHQLRRHPIQWKAISTLEATRLLMNDMAAYGDSTRQSHPWNVLSSYQQIADAATRTQLGPHR